MRCWDGLEEVPSDVGPTVVTVGVFDGVHRGHQQILRRAREVAEPDGSLVVAVTFEPHPAVVLAPDRVPAQLVSLGRRIALLGDAGADAALVLRFTEALSKESPEGFIKSVLTGALQARHLVVGSNFRFGHKGAGDAELVRSYGIRAEALPLAGPEAGNGTWSSTYIRARVADGDVAAAAQALGRPHRVEGVVVEGERRGRDLGFPTANVDVPEGMAVPADGVYAGWLVLGEAPAEEVLPAAVSVGTNPTFGGTRRTV
jgi:riboflavin kinase/FMN adenylyltransferase